MEAYQAVFKRKEVKYLLTEAQLAALRPALEAHMEPDAFAHSSIYNLYYDTPHVEFTNNFIKTKKFY